MGNIMITKAFIFSVLICKDFYGRTCQTRDEMRARQVEKEKTILLTRTHITKVIRVKQNIEEDAGFESPDRILAPYLLSGHC